MPHRRWSRTPLAGRAGVTGARRSGVLSQNFVALNRKNAFCPVLAGRPAISGQRPGITLFHADSCRSRRGSAGARLVAGPRAVFLAVMVAEGLLDALGVGGSDALVDGQRLAVIAEGLLAVRGLGR